MSKPPVDFVRIGHAFRQAFEQVDLSDAPGSLPHFPNGCCSWATWMVGHYLKYECNLSPIEIQGNRDGAAGVEPHAWLSVDGVIVDITCDQFNDCAHVILGVGASHWHSRWSVTRTDEIRPISSHDRISLRGVCPSDIYKRIKSHVDAQLTSPD